MRKRNLVLLFFFASVILMCACNKNMASEENEKVRDEKVEETTSSQSDIDDLSSVSQDDIDCFFTSNYGKILNFVTESVKEYPAPSSDQPLLPD